MHTSDTIVAISSAIGESARIIVRLSGSTAQAIANQLSRRLGRFSDQGSVERLPLHVADLTFPAWVYSFVAPKSYTGEDLIELHIPGNPLLARMTLNTCQHAGARLAEAGEFTARAYFNGRLDLTEAEGVAATIAAHGEAELAAARQLLAGELSRRLKPVMELLADTLALVEVGIDFVEEDVTFLSAEQIGERLEKIDAMLANLQATSGRFERLSHEPRVVLVGRPNAGKSMLLNALAGETRAVVSPIAGTTRDALSATVFLRRGAIQLFDIAGIESVASGDGPLREIDRQMQSQARQAVDTADVLIQVCDATQQQDDIDLDREPDLFVFSKADLIDDFLTARPQSILISAVTGNGMDLLRERLDAIVFGTESPGATLSLTSRHWQSIEDARASLVRAKHHAALEILATELRECLDALGQILGVVAPDELLGRIFSAFCIGK